jgi:hypothetical protein
METTFARCACPSGSGEVEVMAENKNNFAEFQRNTLTKQLSPWISTHYRTFYDNTVSKSLL